MHTIFMFSGQGSHYFQMGKELFESNAVFRGWMHELDAVAEEGVGESVLEALYAQNRGKGDVFDRLRLTHPAIFMVEYALAQTLVSAGVRPDRVLGVSLGSFAAAALAGRVDPERALRAAIRQAIAVEKHCPPGGMLAVLADPALFEESFIANRSELAAINFPKHFTVTGPSAELDAIESELKRREITSFRLPLSFAFHSRWIDAACMHVETDTEWAPSGSASPPLECCESKGTIDALPGDYFWRVVRRPIFFRETIAGLERLGAHRYVDVGPAGTLATFLKYGLASESKSITHALMTPYGRETANLASLLAAVQRSA